MVTQATDILISTIWEDGDVVEMARFLVDGANGVQADVSTIVRKIFDKANANALIATDSLTVSSVVYDTLQTTALDPNWTKDSTGYNFRDRIAGSNFPTGGRIYRVEYYFVGANSEQFWIIYQHPAQKVLSS